MRTRTWWLALGAFSLVACSINPPLELSQVTSKDRLFLGGVPFYPQTEYECGPASLAGLLGAAGAPATPATLSPQVYLPDRQGSLQLELVAATRRAGRIPFVLDSTPTALVAQIEAGRPVLILQNLQTRDFPVWHYAVLVGFDTAANRVYLNSASEQGLAMGAPEFLRTWDWAGRWAMVALRPGELPADAQSADAASARFIEALLDFEAVAGATAALPAWESAQTRWPGEPLPYLALGNHAYADGDLQAAVSYYRRGLGYSAWHSALRNNLASVLGELGCPRAAEAILEPVAAAMPGDSQWAPVFATTLAELASQSGSDPTSCAAAGAGL
jgi:hypothetical protein